MLLAIDLGNTETRAGVWDGVAWVSVWRRPTDPSTKPDAFTLWLGEQHDKPLASNSFSGAILASVVPQATEGLMRSVAAFTESSPVELKPDVRLSMEIRYDPPASLGADRLANALAARAQFKLPALVVDIGTATTFEAIDESGAFVGGAIMPGPAMSAAALWQGTAALPEAAIEVPDRALGANTMAGLQSGIMLGHAAAIQGLALRLVEELGGDATVIATGGLGGRFLPLCPVLQHFYPNLTLDGLVVAHGLLAS